MPVNKRELGGRSRFLLWCYAVSLDVKFLIFKRIKVSLPSGSSTERSVDCFTLNVKTL